MISVLNSRTKDLDTSLVGIDAFKERASEAMSFLALDIFINIAPGNVAI